MNAHPELIKRRKPHAGLTALSVVCLVCLAAPASPVQHPKRGVNAYTVDLGSLFKWWTKREGPRPLSSWVHITGTIVGTNTGAWILEAQVEGGKSTPDSASPRILLQNPPVEDLVEFEQLSGRLNELIAQRANLAGEESQARMNEQAVAGQQRASRRNPTEARLLAVEDKKLKQTESTARAEQKNLDQQITEIKAKLAIYPNTDHFALDCFALDLQCDYSRLPVYDHGRVIK